MAEADRIALALAQLSDDDLRRLRASAKDSSDVLRLLAFIDHAADWEQHRRRDVNFERRPRRMRSAKRSSHQQPRPLAVLAPGFHASGHHGVAELFNAISDALRDQTEPRGTLH
jgi:hypothetical protein